MTQHILQGRSEQEVLWFQRRSFLQAAAAWSAMGGFAAAHAQQRTNIVELRGDALLNGARLNPQQSIQTGDSLQTGPGSHLIFVLGNSAFQVRQDTRMNLERGLTLNLVSALRMITGAVASVWSRGTSRQIVTPTLTAGIRGTGVYTEVLPQQNFRSYFCNCYGTVDVGAGTERVLSQSVYHQSFWGEPEPKNGRYLTAARAINHTDEEMENLAALVGEQTAWQLQGRRGTHDGSGYMEDRPVTEHPANGPR
jgi:hypothetical protein